MTNLSSQLRFGLGPACLLMVLLVAPTACDPGFPTSEGEASVDRDTFVEVYVELRLAALEWESGRVPEAERDRILAEHGVSEDDLREFIEVHGRNVPFMNDVWHEVSDRIRAEMEPDEGLPGLPEGELELDPGGEAR